MRIPNGEMVCFRTEFVFRDGPTASVCGFCRRERRLAVEDCFQTLSGAAFGFLRDGLLIDHRLSRLLAEAAAPERDSIFLTAACIRMPQADSPCGAVLGDLFAPAESAAEDCAALTLKNGLHLHLILRPGTGAVAFFCAEGETEETLYAEVAASFPERNALERLEQEAEGFLWTVDHAPDNSALNGSCLAYLRGDTGAY